MKSQNLLVDAFWLAMLLSLLVLAVLVGGEVIHAIGAIFAL